MTPRQAPAPRRGPAALIPWLPALLLGGLALLTVGLLVAAETAPAPAPTTAPITTLAGPVGDLLRRWAGGAEGGAAGNTGDFYDNRDRGHSLLDTKPFPQLQRITYTDTERKTNGDWAMQTKVRPEVVFGNSSTAASVLGTGSNPRNYYCDPKGLGFLFLSYTHHNLYLYPAHQDHHPGHDGNPNYGDVFPTNTPYLIISQGSSGTDQPFLRALPPTLAAFRPEVKKKLIDSGLLMPAIQMIFRMSNKQVGTPADYLTGKAHPTVFEGKDVDELKMVQLAHSITPDTIPPLALLKVVEEDTAAPGRDYFEAALTEQLSDSPCAIARVYRSTAPIHRMVVSAEGSIDANNRALTYHWVVLRGDADKIKINPLDIQGTRAEILIPYHGRAPIAQGSAMESNRVDIGVFVSNGTFYSPPAFITSFSLDDEARTYDDGGHILEVGYDMGESSLAVTNFAAFFDALGSGATSAPAPRNPLAPVAVPGAMQLLLGSFTPEERDTLRAAGIRFRGARVAMEAARQRLRDAQAAKPRVDADINAAQNALSAATRSVDDLVNQPHEGLSRPIKPMLEAALTAMHTDPVFAETHADLIERLYAATPPDLQAAVLAERQRLIALGIARAASGTGIGIILTPLRPGAPSVGTTTRPGAGAPPVAGGTGVPPAVGAFTSYECYALACYNAELLTNLFYPGMLAHTVKLNYVDFRLTAPKSWRDVYHYDAAGHLRGWTRYDLVAGKTEFTRDGLLVVSRDAQGRPQRVRAVRYDRQQTPAAKPDRGAEGWSYWFPLRQVATDQFNEYVYDGPSDQLGHLRTALVP